MRILAAIALGVLMLGARVEAKRARYELRTAKVKYAVDEIYKSEEFDLRLWDRARQRVLWKRRVKGHGANWSPDRLLLWSRDKRAMAIIVVAGDVRMLVWREGYRLRELSIPAGFDYTMGWAWSSDNRRLLLRLGGSGAVDVDLGSLYCLKLERWPHYKYFKLPFEGDGVRSFGWKSRKVAWFQAVDVDATTGNTLRPRKLWHAP